MMTIEGILVKKGSDLDLFHPKYFSTVDKLMDFMVHYHVYLYGNHEVNHSPTSVVVDCKKFIKSVSASDFTRKDRTIEFNKDIEKSWETTPIILPQHAWITDHLKVCLSDLRTRFLSVLDEYTPKYISLDQSSQYIRALFRDRSSDLYLAQTSNEFNARKSIYFVNGLCCFPEVVTDTTYGEAVRLTNGKTYLSNQSDRNRGVVVVDFSKLCNVRFIPLSQCDEDEDTGATLLPNTVDVDNSSILLVVDGRLFLPNEFAALSKTTKENGLVTYESRSIEFDYGKYLTEYVADKLCCSGDFVSYKTEAGRDLGDTKNVFRRIFPTRNINVGEVSDLKEASNSFVIVFDKPGMKVVEHQCLSGTNESQFVEELQNGEPMHHLLFGRDAAGLLFDRTTRSVVDYMLEENDQTFFTTGNTLPLRWCTKFLRTNLTVPLEMWCNYNNDMSASASMHDNKTVRGSAMVLWPRYTMLDFIFEGN